MRHYKRVCLLALLFLTPMLLSACGAGGRKGTPVDSKEHFMVNGRLYWASASPSGTMPETFQYAGNITETLWETPTSDWSAYSLSVGTKIYLDPQKPHQAWVDGKYRYHVIDAGYDYVMHDGFLYVYLGSVNSSNDEYYREYAKWNYIVNIKKYETIYLGTTIFEEYDSYPLQELGCNSFTNAQEVYSYSENPDILFVAHEDEGRVYVKAGKDRNPG